VSHSARFSDYRAALTTPGAGVAALMSLLARMPIAMIGLSLLLYVQRETGSFATAGLVSAGSLVGVATGAVVQGRVMDRLGPTRPLLAVVGVFAAAVAAVVIAVETRQPGMVLVLLGAVVGLSEPQVPAASRALWSTLLPPGPTRNAAYAYEAISLETFFVLGPALAGVLVIAPWGGTGVTVGAACMVVGSIGFALSPAVRRVRPAHDASSRDLLGALASPGMRTVALAAFGFGITVGFVEVAVPAAATEAGHPSLGGLMLAMFSLTSVAFGLFYAVHPWPRPMHLRLPVLLGLFALLIAPMAIPAGLLWLTVALLVAGIWITPQSTAHSMAIELVAPRGTATEAFGWVVTSVTLGLAAGHSTSGYLVEHVGIPAAFLASSASGLVVTAVIWMRRGTLVPAPAAQPEIVGARG
jgi:MFS family permease